jgi:hypothetical protein
MQLAVPLRPLRQLVEDEQRPLVTDARHDLLDIDDVGRELLTRFWGRITPRSTYLRSSH